MLLLLKKQQHNRTNMDFREKTIHLRATMTFTVTSLYTICVCVCMWVWVQKLNFLQTLSIKNLRICGTYSDILSCASLLIPII